MPIQINQIQQLLNKYNKQLRSRDRDGNSSGLSDLGSEMVTISTEGRQRGLMGRIGDDAVNPVAKEYANFSTVEDLMRSEEETSDDSDSCFDTISLRVAESTSITAKIAKNIPPYT